jgi:hypothetical protein
MRFSKERIILSGGNFKFSRTGCISRITMGGPQMVKGLKSRLLTDLIRLLVPSPYGRGYTIERAEVIARDNKYQLIDSFTLC